MSSGVSRTISVWTTPRELPLSPGKGSLAHAGSGVVMRETTGFTSLPWMERGRVVSKVTSANVTFLHPWRRIGSMLMSNMILAPLPTTVKPSTPVRLKR